jgi:hypothetical protein
MDNFDPGQAGNQNFNESIPLDDEIEKPVPFEDVDAGNIGASHSPLDLGSSRPVEVQKIQKQQPKPATQIVNKAIQADSTGRITAIRTFFTKLHTGALSFLDDQIIDWLKKNPDIVIKKTNVCVGEVQGKKTEPNIVITVWY